MGCSGIDTKETGLDGKNLQIDDIDLKNSLILYLSPKIPLNIKIGIYVDTVLIKKKGLEKIIKYNRRKFFIKNDSKKSYNPKPLLKDFLEKFPQFSRNDDISKNKNNNFSPNYLLNEKFNNLFSSLKINTSNKVPFAICFINEKENDSNLLTKINLIKDKFENNFFIYKIKQLSDIYSSCVQYTLFFRENKINFWLENDSYNNSYFNFLLNYNQKQNILETNPINSITTLNKDSIKNYLNTLSKPEDEFIIRNKYVELYDKNGNIVLFNEFPTIILTSKPNQYFVEQIIFINSKQKININNYIINELKKLNLKIDKIEVFKERVLSIIIRNYFIFKKKYTLYLSPIEKDILHNLIKNVKENINENLKTINFNYSIENIIVMPDVNTKFKFFEENKKIYLIVNYSTCFNYVMKNLKEKYEDIYGEEVIQIICMYNEDNEGPDISQLTDFKDVIYTNEKLILRDDKYIDFFIYSFNPINYFSHILIIVDNEGIIKYANYFKNRASIFYDFLRKEQLSINQSLPLIEEKEFKNVKKFYSQKLKTLLDNIQIGKNENIIEYDDEKMFENFYKNNIFYQPYLSLKYNKIININKKNEKNYKNYSLNFIALESSMEMLFDESEHKPLNEISHIYYEKNNLILYQKELRCKECFYKFNNNKQYIFYLCPISKDIICKDCYNGSNAYESNYPFNLLYIKCKNKIIIEKLPKENILLFRDRINLINHPEIMDEVCDICSNKLCSFDNQGYGFYILVNIIRKNNFLICNDCFELLNDDKRNWNYNNKYNYIYNLILNNFIDLDNLIFKKVKLN